jgi:hypothetical protein
MQYIWSLQIRFLAGAKEAVERQPFAFATLYVKIAPYLFQVNERRIFVSALLLMGGVIALAVLGIMVLTAAPTLTVMITGKCGCYCEDGCKCTCGCVSNCPCTGRYVRKLRKGPF